MVNATLENLITNNNVEIKPIIDRAPYIPLNFFLNIKYAHIIANIIANTIIMLSLLIFE